MSMEFCDWEPCVWLKRFFDHKLDDGKQGEVSMTIVVRSRKAKTKTITFWYCPFCGTRIHNNKEVLRWIEDNRK